MLNAALNQRSKQSVIADKVKIVELEMATQVCASPPTSTDVVAIFAEGTFEDQVRGYLVVLCV